MKYPVFFLFIAVVVISCSTEVDINAPYQKTTVIYGLLNSDENGDGVNNALDTQWVKINKTFLGDGNNYDYAQVRDSSEYEDEDFAKKVVQQIHDGEVVAEFELVSKEVSNKNINGIFYAPLQTVYYFIPKDTIVSPPIIGLEEEDEYKILLQFADGREVSAVTNLINYSQFNWQSPQPGSTLNLASVNSANPTAVNYNDEVRVTWYPALNAEIYNANLRFNYIEEVYASSDWSGTPISSTEKYLDFFMGSTDLTRKNAQGNLYVTFSGRAFFTFLEGSLEKNPNIRRRLGAFTEGKTRCFEVHLSIGNEILGDYISVNSPSTGIVQEKPIYTNVTNGLGLFAGRGTKTLKNIPLVSTNNNGTLLLGNLNAFFQPGIADLNFCDPNPGSDYSCD